MHQFPLPSAATPLPGGSSEVASRPLRARAPSLRAVGIALAVTGGVGSAALMVTRRSRTSSDSGQAWRPKLSSLAVSAICGGAGECASVVATYPLDTLKVRCQTQGLGCWQVLRGVLLSGNRVQALAALYSGVVPVGLTAVVSGALYLSIFAGAEILLTKVSRGMQRKGTAESGGGKAGSEWRESSPWVAGLSAASASLIIACLELPTEVVRLRMQSGTTPGNFVEHFRWAFRDVLSTGWLSYLAPCLIKEVPQDSAEFVTYGMLARCWDDHAPVKADATPYADCIIGAGAGTAAVLISMPADVMKTRLACVSPAALSSGPFGCIRSYAGAAGIVFRESGITGFYAGLGPRLLRVPSTMIYWVTVETTRRLLEKHCSIDGGKEHKAKP
mmetsp:Transcript_22126/g.61417  ORF Transcript_22126/g.61417 Transcript_22126/m.61417 type:complete len:388 (+) Transcript_22126:333-1496(+)